MIMNWIRGFIGFAGLLMIGSCTDPVPDFPVKYRVTFTALWNVNTHPVNYPSDASFSPFIAYSHKASSDLFTVGLIAPESIRILAENGLLTRAGEDIDILRSSDRALDRTTGDGVSYPRSSEAILGFDDAHTMATVLAKISPSPDWYVAATNVQLYSNGAWVDSLTVETAAYDAGSDMGTTFDSADQPTNPLSAISVINTSPLAENGTVRPLVRIGFKKVK